MVIQPYFMSNAEWYTTDEETGELLLTDCAPDEARADYEAHKSEYNKVFRERLKANGIDAFVQISDELTFPADSETESLIANIIKK